MILAVKSSSRRKYPYLAVLIPPDRVVVEVDLLQLCANASPEVHFDAPRHTERISNSYLRLANVQRPRRYFKSILCIRM